MSTTSPPPRGRRLHGRGDVPAEPSTSDRILEVALDLFSEQGYEGTTLQQIADRLGFTKAAVYYHYRSKDDILHALVAPVTTELDELLDAHEQFPNTPANRRRFLSDYLDYLIAHRRLMGYIASDLAIVTHAAFAGRDRARGRDLTAKLAGDDLTFSEEVRTAVALRGIPRVITQYPDADPAQLREALLDAAYALLKPRARRGTVRACSGDASQS